MIRNQPSTLSLSRNARTHIRYSPCPTKLSVPSSQRPRRPARAPRRATWYTHNFGDLSGRGEVPDSSSDELRGCLVPGRPLTALERGGFDAYLYCSSLGRVTSSQTT